MRRDIGRHGGSCRVDFQDGGHATVLDSGARLTELHVPQLTEDVPLLWDGTPRPSSLAVSGVSPVFPWFAGGRGRHRRPSHGLVADSSWGLQRMIERGRTQEIEYTLNHAQLDADPEGERRHEFSARMLHGFAGPAVEPGSRAGTRLDFLVRNDGTNVASQAVGVLAAVRVGDIEQCWVTGVDGHDWSGLDGQTADTMLGELSLHQPLCRLFEPQVPTRNSFIEMHDPSLGRTVTITGSGITQSFVWRPPYGDDGVADVDGDEHFVVLGFVNVRRTLVRLMPGQTHQMAFGLTVRAGA
ncbi:hypothetical protein [Propioniferax innocua]|uniref:D-hexose-6-phosphate mutarotase n=1 Tax=Propioniferax innocua TaxID=1753 RepID=A0A542Z8C0_9ACTN|nr:hypothetical protein [Propioniferax innocua]TQL56584.1 D-hexose-6-phosphate mutarotase [Propioniferax innocua]